MVSYALPGALGLLLAELPVRQLAHLSPLDVAVIAIYFAIVIYIGFYLKRKMQGENNNNLLFGLTNDAFGYILTKVDFQSFPRYDYVSRTSLGEMTGEILMDTILKLVAKNGPPEHLATK